MAYVRRTWQERVGTLLNRFTKSSETSASVVLVNDPDTITQAGTPFTAAAMNNIEDGIVEALAKVPTGVDNNVLLSDGAGKAKDSGKAVGNASGNVPLANGTKCDNLYADKALLLEYTPLQNVNALAVALPLGGERRYLVYNTCTGMPIGGFCWLYVSGYYSSPTSGTLWFRVKQAGTLQTFEISWVNGVYGSWTQLTDASGNAINANSLGGVAAAFYTGFIGNGTTLQNGTMANNTQYTANAGCSGHITINVNTSTASYIDIFINGRQVTSVYNLISIYQTYPIKAGQTFQASAGNFASAWFEIKAALS